MESPQNSTEARNDDSSSSDRNNDSPLYSSSFPTIEPSINNGDDESEPYPKSGPQKFRVPTVSKLAEMVLDPQKTYHLMSVLPSEFQKWVENEYDIPQIHENSLNSVYPVLAHIIDCPDYVVNLRSFWYLDIIAEAVDHAQREVEMEMGDQKLLIAWFGHLFKLFLEKRWTREEILSNAQDEIIALGYNLANISWAVPIRQEPKSYLVTGEINLNEAKEDDNRSRTVTMAYITSLIYDVFANPFQFYLILNYFFKPPEITDVKMPHKIHFPKTYKPVTETPKAGKVKKDDKKAPKGGQKLKETASDKRSFEEDANNYILPLRDAVSKEFFRLIFGNKDGQDKNEKNDKK